MEISLEKIELVKDRTGVSYKEAKDALIKADGSVVDAIIMIEDEIDITPKTKAGDQASQVVEKIKQLVKKGNVSRIVISREGKTILNIPVNIGIIGVIWVPWVTVVSTIAALGTKCTIELVKDNGEIINFSEKAVETFTDVKENCSVIADDLMEKGGDAFSQMKDKASDVINKNRPDYDYDGGYDVIDDDDDYDAFADDDYFNFDDFDDSVFDNKTDGSRAAAGKTVEQAAAVVADKVDDLEDKIEDIADAVEEKAEDIRDTLSENLEKAEDKFEETIKDYKAKKSKFKFFE